MWKLRGRHSNNPASCWPAKLPKTSSPEDLPGRAAPGAWRFDEVLAARKGGLCERTSDFLPHGASRAGCRRRRRRSGRVHRRTHFPMAQFRSCLWRIGDLIAKHGGTFFRPNAKAIAASITEASAAKAEADRELREVETKIARLDQEIAEMRAAARRDTAAETERLRVSGLVEMEKIRQAARGELVAAERAAQQELRAIAASMAV